MANQLQLHGNSRSPLSRTPRGTWGFWRDGLSSLLAASLSVFLLAGCGPPGPAEGSDEDLIREAISSVADLAGQPQRFQDLFSGSPPDDATRARYGDYGYRIAEDAISQSGDSATVEVRLTAHATGDVVATMQWTCVRDGEAWKLESAPLPPATN